MALKKERQEFDLQLMELEYDNTQSFNYEAKAIYSQLKCEKTKEIFAKSMKDINRNFSINKKEIKNIVSLIKKS